MNQNATPQSRAYSVVGMTCGHCAVSVREEVAEVGGVRDVAAVEEAGYRLAA